MLYINFSAKPLNFAQNAQFPISAYFGDHFCYHSNDISQSNLRLLHFGYFSIKLITTNWRKTFFLYFSLMGGGGVQRSPLMHVAFYSVYKC